MVDDEEQGHVPFSVVELDTGAPAGTATLWSIDNHAARTGCSSGRCRTTPPLLRAAERNGFARESVPRSSARVMGEFMDDVLLGLPAQDWKPAPRG